MFGDINAVILSNCWQLARRWSRGLVRKLLPGDKTLKIQLHSVYYRPTLGTAFIIKTLIIYKLIAAQGSALVTFLLLDVFFNIKFLIYLWTHWNAFYKAFQLKCLKYDSLICEYCSERQDNFYYSSLNKTRCRYQFLNTL